MPAAQAAVMPSLKASFRPRISPHERQNQLPFREIAKRDCEKEFWPFLSVLVALFSAIVWVVLAFDSLEVGSGLRAGVR